VISCQERYNTPVFKCLLEEFFFVLVFCIRFHHSNWLFFLTRFTYNSFINSAPCHREGMAGREMCKDVGISLLSFAGGKYRVVSPRRQNKSCATRRGYIGTVKSRLSAIGDLAPSFRNLKQNIAWGGALQISETGICYFVNLLPVRVPYYG